MGRKRLIWLALSVLFIFGVIAFAYHKIRDLDTHYSELVEAGTRQLRVVQNLGFDSNRSYALMLIAMQSDREHAAEVLKERNRIRDKNTKVLDSLLSSTKDSTLRARIENIIKARETYLANYDHFVFDYVESGTRPDFKLLTSGLDPSFMEYQNQINRLFIQHNDLIRSQSSDFSQMATQSANTLILMTVSPVVVIVLVVVIAITFIYYIMKDLDTERT